MSLEQKIIKQKPPHLRGAKIKKTSKDNSISDEQSQGKTEYRSFKDKQNTFLDMESQINSQIDTIITKLETIRNGCLENLRKLQEKFFTFETSYEQRDLELCQFIDVNSELESNRNSLMKMQNYHVETLKRKLALHRKNEKPSPPYIGFSCETKRIISTLERIKLITYSPNDEISSITEKRIKDWKSMPESVAVDNSTGQIYYSDPDNSCVWVYDMQEGHIGEIGLWSDKMLTPKSIAILKNELYVADVGLNKISKFNLTTHDFIAHTKAPLTFTNLIAIAFNEEELYVLDQERRLTVLNPDLQFLRGYKLRLSCTNVPIDFKVFNGIIYMMQDNEVVWFEEPETRFKTNANGEENHLVYKELTYNSIIKTPSGSSRHLCLDELGNILRTEKNGQLVINASDGSEIFRKSFSDEEGVENLTGVCVTEKGWVVVGVDNRDHILHVLKTNDFENSEDNSCEVNTYI